MIAAVSSGERFSRLDVQSAVLQLATLIGGGYPYRAARVCGFSKARLYDWIEGKRLVKYPALLALCSAAGANVVNVLRGRIVCASGHGYSYSPRASSKVKLSTPEIRRLIDEATTNERCPSVSSVARRAGMSRTTLTRRFPEEARCLVIRWKDARAAEAQERRTAAAQRLVMLATELKADGVPWTVRNIWLRCGVLVTSGSRYHQPFLELKALESRTQDRSDTLDSEGR
jgi:AraC-like DNA-binding protein